MRWPSIVSLEMRSSEIVMRMLSAEARIKLAYMRAGRMSDNDWTRMARRMGEISETPLCITECDDDADPGQGAPAQEED